VIRGPEVLEDTRRITTIALDKTGTITTARMTLESVTAADHIEPAELLALVGAAEHASEHPIARAIADAAAEAGPQLPVDNFVSTTGLGVSGLVDGHAVAAGRPEWLVSEWSVDVLTDNTLASAIEQAHARGATVVAVTIDGMPAGVLTVSDTIRPTSAQAIADLRKLGLRPVLISGDHHVAALTIATAVGIDSADVVSGVLPEGKVAEVLRLQAMGETVAMVGDGVNDAAALVAADLGIAMGTGTDAAIDAADITLVAGDLAVAPTAIRLSRRTLATIKGNLAWAFGYNVAMIPLAMAGLLTPLLAGAAMALSSVFVVTNSLRLRSFR